PELTLRIDRLARALRALGVGQGERVASFAWNNQRHFELYMGVPCVGAVLHTLNVRLFAEQLTYIVNHAEDKVIFVDDSLVPVLEPLVGSCSRKRARGASTIQSSTSARLPPSVTRAAPPATPRGCSTRIARSACTPRPR